MRVSTIFKLKRRVRQIKTAAKIAAIAGTAIGAGASIGAAVLVARRFRRVDFRDKVVVITGGSRGLGFAMAQEFARAGARLSLCARDERELDWARQDLAAAGADVLTTVCDISNSDEVQNLITATMARFGRIDVLVNNAGIITVGPVQSQTLTDYQESMDVMFWGVVYPTLAVLPHMMARGSGWIANITSIGGKVSVPHLLPYSCAKFAAVGFSEGLRAEVKKYGVNVTTVVPWLMRTGSHLNAYFKGSHRREFTLFSLSATLPGVAMNARNAARRIVRALAQKRAELILTPQGKALATFHGMFPGLTAEILALVNAFLPETAPDGRVRHLGKHSETPVTESFLTSLGRKAAREFHQVPGTYAEGPGPKDREAAQPGTAMA